MTKTGLVLEGGGMRGIYTAGVLDVFLEHDIAFDGVIGVSAGAIHGATYVAKQKGRSIRYYKRHIKERRFMSIWNLITTGDYVGKKFCYQDLPNIYDPFDYKAFQDSKTKFYAGMTDVATGRPAYKLISNMKKQMKLIRASASLPIISKPVLYRGHIYLDGGCSDSIPVQAMRERGYNRIVVIETRDRSYIKKPMNMRLIRNIYRHYPRFCHQLSLRHVLYNQTRMEIEAQAENGRLFLIQPSKPLQIGRLEKDPKKLQEIYDIGRMDAEMKLAEMKKWLADTKAE